MTQKIIRQAKIILGTIGFSILVVALLGMSIIAIPILAVMFVIVMAYTVVKLLNEEVDDKYDKF
jgi:hypothetical protein